MTAASTGAHGPVASVVIPAHNEERVIGRLLTELSSAGGALEVLVVCNGCTDATATVARTHDVTVLEIAEPSKRAAMERGDRVAATFPRIFLDADVEITAGDLLMLAAACTGPILATGPARRVPRARSSWAVRWYYDMWESLPQVRDGLFGRGVVALSEEGCERVRRLPPSMSDDLVISEAFADSERSIVTQASVVVHPPRTLRDLVRRRVRVTTGNVQADTNGLRGRMARTTPLLLARLVVDRPVLLLRLPVFLAVTLVARIMAARAVRRGDYTTWLRDESSRS
ncbi:glycosyltransferase [Georgenia yuyongxinii]